MDAELRIQLKHIIRGLLVFGCSSLSIFVVAFYSYCNVSPGGTGPAPSGLAAVNGMIFTAFTLLGAFTVGRSWRIAPAGVGLIAVSPLLILCAMEPSLTPWHIGIVGFVFAVYFLANRWGRSKQPVSAQDSPVEQ